MHLADVQMQCFLWVCLVFVIEVWDLFVAKVFVLWQMGIARDSFIYLQFGLETMLHRIKVVTSEWLFIDCFLHYALVICSSLSYGKWTLKEQFTQK